MATVKVKSKSPETVQIHTIKQGLLKLRIIGDTPMYFNSMGSKAMRDLLVGAQRKTAAEKREIKHNPEKEFRETMYRQKDGKTMLYFPSTGIKKGLATAALETAGITKANVNRLIYIPEAKIDIWGKPYLKMDVVRAADMNRTPDIRTRAYLPRWCSEVTIKYCTPTFNAQGVISLLANSGMICGLGDNRQEKGNGSFGSFSVYSAEDMGEGQGLWDEIVAEGLEVQELAYEYPECYDHETQELMDFLNEERIRRAA
jgi:hypothetical protein